MMALVQAMVHATHLAQAGVLRQYQPQLGDLAAMMPYRSASFELDTAIISRILSLNPAIYEDIQFGNPYVAPMLERLVGQLQACRCRSGRATTAHGLHSVSSCCRPIAVPSASRRWRTATTRSNAWVSAGRPDRAQRAVGAPAGRPARLAA
jgi:hypothetical protein